VSLPPVAAALAIFAITDLVRPEPDVWVAVCLVIVNRDREKTFFARRKSKNVALTASVTPTRRRQNCRPDGLASAARRRVCPPIMIESNTRRPNAHKSFQVYI